jgi:hypothetical protein
MIRFSLPDRHLRLLAGQDLIHLSGGRKAAVQDQVGQVLLILQCIGLGQDAVAAAGQRKLTQIQRQTHVFHVPHIVSTVERLESRRRWEMRMAISA